MRSRFAIPVVLALLTVPLAAPAMAADPSTDGLVITEYVEGSSFNKAVEIYNGTGVTVDLEGLELRLYSNGRPLADGPSASHAFTGELADGDVYVLTHPSFNDDEGFVLGGDVDATSGAVNFNGDDAFTLVDTTTGEVVDSFGQVGVRQTYGQDVTLRRTDLTRDTVADDAWDDSAWASFPSNTVDQLGVFPDGDGGGGTDPSACDTPAEELTLISEIQGSGIDPTERFDSPLDGQTHTIRAVVTMADSDLNGYFVQEEPADHDDDPMSSEGLTVRLPVERHAAERRGHR